MCEVRNKKKNDVQINILDFILDLHKLRKKILSTFRLIEVRYLDYKKRQNDNYLESNNELDQVYKDLKQ